jgi:hypothetical protein
MIRCAIFFVGWRLYLFCGDLSTPLVDPPTRGIARSPQFANYICVRQEGSEPADFPKIIEEVWRREWIIVMWCRDACLCTYTYNVAWLCCLPVYWCVTVQLDWEGQVQNEWVRTNKEDTYERKPARGSVHLWIKTMQDVFARCLKLIAVQVCIDLWLCNYTNRSSCCKFL